MNALPLAGVVKLGLALLIGYLWVTGEAATLIGYAQAALTGQGAAPKVAIPTLPRSVPRKIASV